MVHPGEPPLVRARPEPLPVEEDLRGRGKDDQGTLRRARCGTERWDRWVGGRPSREGTLRRSSRAAADTSAKARDVQRATWRRGHAASALGSRARATSGGSVARPMCARMAATVAASVTSARSARRPPQGQDRTSTRWTRRRREARALEDARMARDGPARDHGTLLGARGEGVPARVGGAHDVRVRAPRRRDRFEPPGGLEVRSQKQTCHGSAGLEALRRACR